jgi:hypothetical protein
MADFPVRPERPSMPTNGEKPRRGSNWIVVIAAFLMGAVGLTSLMVMPLLNFFPVIVLAVFCFIAFHHFVWGRWLSKALRDEAEEDESKS